MIKISLKALTNILLKNGHTFTVRKSSNHKDKLVYAFVVGSDYPNVGPVVHYGKDDFDTSTAEVKQNKKGKIVVLYDTTQDMLLGVSCEILDLIKDAKREAIREMFSKKENPEPKTDPYGRQTQEC